MLVLEGTKRGDLVSNLGSDLHGSRQARGRDGRRECFRSVAGVELGVQIIKVIPVINNKAVVTVGALQITVLINEEYSTVPVHDSQMNSVDVHIQKDKQPYKM